MDDNDPNTERFEKLVARADMAADYWKAAVNLRDAYRRAVELSDEPTQKRCLAALDALDPQQS